ncbi:MAG: hypothetical protein K8W52_38205 [Deltaproteobacteria bacterium]|nr:hypothetical protein [Deltaproteobacteria bacterium]
MSLLARYRGGDRAGAWAALAALGPRVREPAHLDDAIAVARAAMTRARANVETVIARLRGQGYVFGDAFGQIAACAPHAPPDRATPGFVRWLEGRFGPLPLTLTAWIEIVGDVSLVGAHPAWPIDAVVDPLVIEVEYKSWAYVARDRAAVRATHEEELAAWRDAGDGDGPFALPVAPDALHKANISGGRPYGFALPEEAADATFRCEDDRLVRFIDYLNAAFRSGGFPGAAALDLGARARGEIAALAEGLLEL